jgi:Reverse transcriptase (RNA-dependent DNA polymerase)
MCILQGTTTFMVYVDDGILIDPDKEKIESALLDLQSKFEVQDEGDLSDYLGVKVQKHADGSIEFTQPHLIDSILEDLKLMENGCRPKTTDTPCKHDSKMHKDEGGKEFDYSWEYRSVIGKLNYLEKSIRGDLAFSVHQCARYMSSPMRSHGEAVKRIGRYLLWTKEKGFIIRPDLKKSF